MPETDATCKAPAWRYGGCGYRAEEELPTWAYLLHFLLLKKW